MAVTLRTLRRPRKRRRQIRDPPDPKRRGRKQAWALAIGPGERVGQGGCRVSYRNAGGRASAACRATAQEPRKGSPQNENKYLI